MRLSSNDYEDDFETDDSGIEDVVVEAAPLVKNVEKNKKGQDKNGKGRYLGKLALELLQALLSAPGKDGKPQRLKVLEKL